MINLDKPRDSDTHTLADFSELLCLLTVDRVCSREIISDQIKDVGDARVSDLRLDDCFNHIAWRAEAFGDYYPFTLDAGRRVINAPEELSERQKLYVLLLLCSSLPFLERKYIDGGLTDSFERIAYLALKSVWPVGAEIRQFGKNETDYVGAKWQRINELSRQIGGVGLCNDTSFRARDSGDGGIDLVAWLQLDSYEAGNIPSALAQCACSRSDWSAKQTEISKDRLGGYMHATHPWMQFIFIPHSFRDNSGSWVVKGEVGLTIVFDRLRVVNRMGEDMNWAYINPPVMFADFLDYRLELV